VERKEINPKGKEKREENRVISTDLENKKKIDALKSNIIVVKVNCTI
jgi:hypothetical protein